MSAFPKRQTCSRQRMSCQPLRARTQEIPAFAIRLWRLRHGLTREKMTFRIRFVTGSLRRLRQYKFKQTGGSFNNREANRSKTICHRCLDGRLSLYGPNRRRDARGSSRSRREEQAESNEMTLAANSTELVGAIEPSPSVASLRGLDEVNLLLAGALSGFGPYVAAFLGPAKLDATEHWLCADARRFRGIAQSTTRRCVA